MFVSTQIHVEARPHNVMIFGGKAFGRQLGLDEVMRVGSHNGVCALIARGRESSAPSLCHVKTQQEGDHLQARKSTLTKNVTMLVP